MALPFMAKKSAEDKVLKPKEKWQNEDFQAKVLTWTKDKYSYCKSARQSFERQWYINIAFYLGKQNVQLFNLNSGSNAGGTRLYVPNAPYWRNRPVINLIRPAIRTELAKLTAQKPSATVVPATNDEKDLYAAQAGEQIWEAVYRDKKLKDKFRVAMQWCLTTGNGFMKTYWDPNKYDKAGNQGDFSFDAITPFHLFFPDMLCQDIEEQPYIIHMSTRTVEWVKLHYPDIKCEPNVTEATDLLNDSFLNLVGASNTRNNAILIYEVWVKPGYVDFIPKGGMFTIIGENLVQFIDTGIPYMHQEYPFSHTTHIPASRFYGDSVINDLIPIQREYNRTRGQITESKNKMGHPQLIAAEGSVDATKITTEPGQVILYKLGFPKPEPMPLQQLPPYILQEVDRLRADFEDISGQHDISKGQTPPGVTAATAISFLQEQDETMLSATFQSIEQTYEKIGYQTLCLVKQYWDMPRIVKVVGTDGQFNAMVFKGADIGNNTDIRIESGSAMPTSKAARQALLMDLMSQGFIPPEKGLELMDVGGVQRLYDQVKTDNAQASRENMKMATVTQDMLSQYLMTFIKQPEMTDPLQGIMGSAPDPSAVADPNNPMPMDPSNIPLAQQDPSQQAQAESPFIDPQTGGPLVDGAGNPTEPPLIVPVNSWDNHQVHIEVHNNYRKSQEFENLPAETKALFEEHVQQHMMSMGVIPGQPMPSGGMMDSGSMQQQNSQDPNADPSTDVSAPDAMMQQAMGASPQDNSQPPTGGPTNG
jgi:hypothetical protein